MDEGEGTRTITTAAECEHTKQDRELLLSFAMVVVVAMCVAPYFAFKLAQSMQELSMPLTSGEKKIERSGSLFGERDWKCSSYCTRGPTRDRGTPLASIII